MLKPNIVYFSESMPKGRVDEGYSLVDEADTLLGGRVGLTDGVLRIRFHPPRAALGNATR